MESLGHYSLLMSAAFIIGYFLITIEHVTKISKTATALLLAAICWTIQFASPAMSSSHDLVALSEHMANISQVVFFLLGALTIVEIISAHQGFYFISQFINVRSKKALLWVIGFASFFLSSILDNLTTTVVMVTLIKKLLDEGEDRLILGGAVVIAANAGGAWTPIGDVTTTMLWIGGQLSAGVILKQLIIPSFVCCTAAFVFLSSQLKGDFIKKTTFDDNKNKPQPLAKIVFILGLSSLLSVPAFKLITGLPPFMGILFGVGLMWLFTDIVHCKHEDREHLRVHKIMSNVDISSVLFFLGILLSVDALHTARILDDFALWMDSKLGHVSLIAIMMGLASAVVDNVPLVAASMGMYSIKQYPIDSNFWQLIAYCAGTGGSILVIGSAAGVAYMGIEKVDFFWYFRKIGVPALVGYIAGIAIFFLFNHV